MEHQPHKAWSISRTPRMKHQPHRLEMNGASTLHKRRSSNHTHTQDGASATQRMEYQPHTMVRPRAPSRVRPSDRNETLARSSVRPSIHPPVRPLSVCPPARSHVRPLAAVACSFARPSVGLSVTCGVRSGTNLALLAFRKARRTNLARTLATRIPAKLVQRVLPICGQGQAGRHPKFHGRKGYRKWVDQPSTVHLTVDLR